MTLDQAGVPAVDGHPSAERGTSAASPVERLVARPLDSFAALWGREPLLVTAGERGGDVFDDLFGEAAVDALVSERGLRTPFLRVARDGSTLPNRDFTAGAGVGAGVADQVDDTRLSTLFAEGSTLVLQGLHRTWPPLVRFVADLAAQLGHPVQANAYVTPPQSQGFDDHYDVHDVFVLQISGAKEWRIHPPVLESPLRDQPWSDRRDAVARAAQDPPSIRAVLRPGDCLYLPRGYLHAATALGDVSTHLTLGVHAWTRHALADELARLVVARLAEDPRVRASLEVGLDPDRSTRFAEDVALVRERMAAVLADVATSDVADSLDGARRRTARPAPVGPLAQLRAAHDLTDDTTLRLRAHLSPALRRRDDGGADLVSRAGTVRVDPDDVDAVRDLVVTGTARAATLGDALARRLLARAVVVVDDA
ncbi:cupin domain-containing protein [Isoptericola sp. NPDC019693]|uniref:cupin domain-containing protein n=1 Tax=Isoptericola sp. NPDC019693 TaxID=3364009 RepID=UPI0037B65F8D